MNRFFNRIAPVVAFDEWNCSKNSNYEKQLKSLYIYTTNHLSKNEKMSLFIWRFALFQSISKDIF